MPFIYALFLIKKILFLQYETKGTNSRDDMSKLPRSSGRKLSAIKGVSSVSVSLEDAAANLKLRTFLAQFL